MFHDPSVIWLKAQIKWADKNLYKILFQQANKWFVVKEDFDKKFLLKNWFFCRWYEAKLSGVGNINQFKTQRSGRKSYWVDENIFGTSVDVD